MWIKFALVVGLLILPADFFGQTVTSRDVLEPVKTANCEFASSMFDTFIQGTDSRKTIIIIAYNGQNELGQMARRRVHNAKTYITEFYNDSPFDRPTENVVAGVAFEMQEQGRMDFYVDGILRLSVGFLKNRDLQLSPCHLELPDYCKDPIKRLFYPCKGKN